MLPSASEFRVLVHFNQDVSPLHDLALGSQLLLHIVDGFILFSKQYQGKSGRKLGVQGWERPAIIQLCPKVTPALTSPCSKKTLVVG